MSDPHRHAWRVLRGWWNRRGRWDRLHWPARPGWWRLPLRSAAALFLGAWTAGLVVAAVQLNAWEDDLVRTLLQIRADAVFRQHMVERREPIPREWYRSKTLALLAASEKLQDDTHWALFVPGSWRPFDGLRQRVAARIERAFSDIVVETVQRELYVRASELTGVPQDRHTAELLATGDCAPPPATGALGALGKAGGAPQELPEFIAVQNQLRAIEQLDRAVQAMAALQGPGPVDAGNLRLLARYTLGVELPGQLSRSVAFFRTSLKPEDVTFTVRGVPRMQRALRCSLAKSMYALDVRLFERNDLLATEAFLAQRASRLFAPRGRPGPYSDAVEGYREVIAAINEQEALLGRAEYAWLHRKGTGTGPHDELLARITRIGLLGPEAVEQLRRQSGAAFERFRRQFGVMFGANGDPALVWREDQGRLVLSPQRQALRDGLTALLQQPFMRPPADHIIPTAAGGPLSWDTRRLQEALALMEERRRFTSDNLPMFPPAVRQPIAQFVDAHLSQLAQDATVEAIGPGHAASAGPSDLPAYRAQREELAKVVALLANLGARGKANKLLALLSQDLLDRLALAEAALWRTAIYSDRTRHFGWWQGEGSPILQAFGAGDKLTLRYTLSQQLGHIEEIGREAAGYLAYVDSAVASNPTVLRWQGIMGELKRYRAGTADSSLRALEHYLLWGAELNRSNCVERLSFATPASSGSDEFAQLHFQIHKALLGRCIELRSPVRMTDPGYPVIPFG